MRIGRPSAPNVIAVPSSPVAPSRLHGSDGGGGGWTGGGGGSAGSTLCGGNGKGGGGGASYTDWLRHEALYAGVCSVGSVDIRY